MKSALFIPLTALLLTALTARMEPRPNGIEVGVATCTFRHLTAFEAIEKTKECGGDAPFLHLCARSGLHGYGTLHHSVGPLHRDVLALTIR